MMKAIRVHEFGGPEVLRIEEVPDPRPDAGEILVRVRAAGVNPVDTYIRSGNHMIRPQLPYTPGLDAAGTIEAIGDGVSSFRDGDRVYTAGTRSGAYAELALCSEEQVHEFPDTTSFSQAAGLYTPYATAYRALFFKARGIAGESVLVHGASGGVGTAAVQLARAAGFTVIGTAGTERGLRLVAEQGAHHVLNHTEAGYLAQLTDVTAGNGVDIILEMLANVNLGNDLDVLAKGGRVVIVGSRGPVEINPRALMMRDGVIAGMTLFNATARELEAAHSAIRAGLENGTLHPVVGRELPLSEAAHAHQAVLEPGAYGKIVLVP